MQLISKKISVIMPAHNEGNLVYENLIKTYKVLRRTFASHEIILVSDGSKDNTTSEARRAGAVTDTIKVVDYRNNAGKGNALKAGFPHASGELIAFLDADLDIHPRQIQTMFHAMEKRDADVIVGSKYHPASKVNTPKRRKLISLIYKIILFIFFRLPLRDTQAGLKLFKTEVLKKVFPKVVCKRFAFDVELLANAHRIGYKIIECPIVLKFRREMRWGNIKFKTLYYTGIDTLAIFYRMYILHYYDKQ
ncbi:MAG: glycosyltransferase [Candidatus Kuenenia sp.]|nr:glycosyltransferase [Candidatus Kuenenia hertensis]